MKKSIPGFLILIFLLGITPLLCSWYSKHVKEKTTLFIIGDSTVKNGKGDGSNGLWGWGDMLKYYFDSSKFQIENYALGGTSSRTFQTKGHWAEVLKKINRGSYVLIQFGHNDGGSYDKGRARASIKGIGNDSIEIRLEETGEKEIVYSYGYYLRKYIHDIRSKGAIPVIISPIPRNIWENNKILSVENSYPQWVKQIAEQEHALYIDLHASMKKALEKCGENNVTGVYFFPHDHTHTTEMGAILNAYLVAEGVSNLSLSGLSEYVILNPDKGFSGNRRLLIIGDSTVKNDNEGLQGWGEELYRFTDTTQLTIINKARGGRSSRTFFYEGLWDEAIKTVQPGDFILIQFGHNDGGPIDSGKMRGSLPGTGNDSIIVNRPDGSVEIVHSYGWYLRKYVQDCKEKGIIPVILSHVPRREWNNGKVERNTETYGKWAQEASEQGGCHFINLNELVAVKYEEIGASKVAAGFFLDDHTHTTPEGAILNAQTVAEGILSLDCCTLKNYFNPDKKTE